MSKFEEVIKMRVALDEAITYGTQLQAQRLTRQALRFVQGQNMPHEVEYFEGQLAMLRKNFAAAIEHFDNAIALNPHDGASYNDRALCMVEQGIIDDALAYFDRGIEVEPDFATIHHNKGWLLNNIGRYSEAIVCFKKALSLDPLRAVTYDNLADALFNLSDYRGALRAYKKVITLLGPHRCKSIRRQIIKRIEEIEGVIAHSP